MNPEKWAEIQKLQKGTHFMSRLHKPFEDFIVYLLYDLKWVSADHVSLITYVFAGFTAYLFATGSLVPALILAVIVGVLDGVDGKIARLRKKPTLIGKLEHSFDMAYEQAWYASYTWWAWKYSGNDLYFALGLLWLILDSLVRHVYNVTWLATGKSLKYQKGAAQVITKIDGRRSVYVLHMILWYVIGKPLLAIWTILIHCASTVVAYIFLGFKAIKETTTLPF